MKHISALLTATVAYLLWALFLCQSAPNRNAIQILSSAISFRPMTYKQIYVPQGAPAGVVLEDSIFYQCPAAGSDPITLAAFQSLLAQEIFGYTRGITPSNFTDMADARHGSYVRDYERMYTVAQMNDTTAQEGGVPYWPVTRYVSTKVLFSTAQAVVIEARHYQYTGGAHGSLQQQRMSIQLGGVHSRVLQKEDILRNPADSVPLIEAIKTKLLHKFKAHSEIELPLLVDPRELPLATNVSVAPDGLTFIYQPYEIAPYSEGFLQITLPYNTVRNYLKPQIEQLFSSP